MKKQLSNHQRVFVVRDVMRRAAVGRAIAARQELDDLEQRSLQLSKLRLSMFENVGEHGATELASKIELGHRLLAADGHVDKALSDARQDLAEKDRQRISAHIDRDAISKLIVKKRATLIKAQEQKNAAFRPFRPLLKKDGK